MKKNAPLKSRNDFVKKEGSQSQNNESCTTAMLNNRTQTDADELMQKDSLLPMVERVKATLAEVEAEWKEELKEYRKPAKGKKDIWGNYRMMSKKQRAKVDEAFDELGKLMDEYDKWSKDLDGWLKESDPDYDILDEDWEVNQQLEEERQREQWDKELEENGMFADE